MSKYTTELRYICEELAGLGESAGYMSVDDVIAKSRAKIFRFDYPIHDDGYKPVLESKIIKHFYTREICAETFGRWQLFLEARMLEIMPKYAEMLRSAEIMAGLDPLRDVDYYKEHHGSGGGHVNDNGGNGGNISTDTDTTTTRTPDLETVTKHSDTPQGALTGLRNETYMSDASITEDSGTEDVHTGGNITQTNNLTNYNKRDFDNTDEYVDHVYGKIGGASYAEMIEHFRAALITVDRMIIDELNDLFMMIW